MYSPFFLITSTFFSLMIRRPPRSTLFPYTSSSDLSFAFRQGQGTLSLRLQPARGIDDQLGAAFQDRKSTRLNSSHQIISYAVFCLKKKSCQSLHAAFFCDAPRVCDHSDPASDPSSH